jgi:hypothetical protein
MLPPLAPRVLQHIAATAASRQGASTADALRAADILRGPVPLDGPPLQLPLHELRPWHRLAASKLDPILVEYAARTITSPDLPYYRAVALCLELMVIAITPVRGGSVSERRAFIAQAIEVGCHHNDIAKHLVMTPAAVRVDAMRYRKAPKRRANNTDVANALYAKFPDLPPITVDAVVAEFKRLQRDMLGKPMPD